MEFHEYEDDSMYTECNIYDEYQEPVTIPYISKLIDLIVYSHNYGTILNIDPSRYEIIDSFISFIISINDEDETIYNFQEVKYCSTHENGSRSVFTLFDSLFVCPLYAIIDVIDYMILKDYINRNDFKFQKMIIKQISKYKYHIEDLNKFLYCCKNYLFPETINSYYETEQKFTGHIYNYSLLDRVIKTSMSITLSKEYIDELFDFFDSIGFQYTNPKYTHLMYFAVESMNSFIIEKLIDRKLNFNSPLIIEYLVDNMRNQINPFQTYTELNMNKIFCGSVWVSDKYKLECEFYKYILQIPELILELYTDNDNKHYGKHIELKVRNILKTLKLNDIDDNFARTFRYNEHKMNNFVKKKYLLNCIQLYETLYRFGFDFEQIFSYETKPTNKYIGLKPMSLYELYIHGSLPIQIVYPEEHQKLKYILIHKIICKLNLPSVLIDLVISWI